MKNLAKGKLPAIEFQLVRAIFFPVYDANQLAFMAFFYAIPAVFVYHYYFDFFPYFAVFCWIGSSISMYPSTPAEMVIPSNLRISLLDLLDNSNMVAIDDKNDRWRSKTPWFGRWNTDTLNISENIDYLRLSGRKVDLEAIRNTLYS